MTSLVASAADDFTVIDGLETVRLKFTDGPAQHAITNAAQRPFRRREMDVSRGQYLAHDTRWTLKASECPKPPVPGSLILDGDGNEWTVLESSRESLSSVYACTCRNLVIAENLTNLITIQEAAYTKNPKTGADEAVWSDLFADLRARVQPEGGSEGVSHGRRELARKFTVFVREKFVLRRNHRIVDSSGAVYRVVGFDHPERIDRLTEIRCEEFKGD